MEQEQSFNVGGKFTFELVRDGKVIDQWEEKNLVVNEGLTHLLSATLGAGTQQTTWFVGLFEGNYTPVGGVTAATIASSATECVAYTESTRPAYSPAAVAGQSITNTASKATFTINLAKTIYGAFLISTNVKGGTAGVLFSATRFSTARSVAASDQLLITYTVTSAPA